MKEKEIKKLLNKKIKPLAGNNRSAHNQATKRKFAANKQKFQVGSKTYYIPVSLFRVYWAKLRKKS